MDRTEDGLQITPELQIPWREFSFQATRAGGAGGQHVNKTATRIELRWNIGESPSLSEEQRELLLRRLAKRLDRSGRLRVVSDERRSQRQNRDAALERLSRLVAAGLRVAPPRKKTRPTRTSVEHHIRTKKLRGETKRARRSVQDYE